MSYCRIKNHMACQFKMLINPNKMLLFALQKSCGYVSHIQTLSRNIVSCRAFSNSPPVFSSIQNLAPFTPAMNNNNNSVNLVKADRVSASASFPLFSSSNPISPLVASASLAASKPRQGPLLSFLPFLLKC